MTRVEEQALVRKMAWRLLPFLLLAYLICIIDRLNVGFAALPMNQELGFTGPFAVGWLKDNTANGFQAGLTFLALCLLTGSIVAVIVGRSVARLRTAGEPA